MANAIKTISTQRGHDVTTCALAGFGAAAGQHACLVADALGIDRVFLHPLAGVLSAYGMGLADMRAIRERTLEAPLGPDAAAHIDAALAALEGRGARGAGGPGRAAPRESPWSAASPCATRAPTRRSTSPTTRRRRRLPRSRPRTGGAMALSPPAAP